MGFSDLIAWLSDVNSKSIFETDSVLTSTIAKVSLEKLDDPISEIQNQAIKWYVTGLKLSWRRHLPAGTYLPAEPNSFLTPAWSRCPKL
jgi:hypothetical protein